MCVYPVARHRLEMVLFRYSNENFIPCHNKRCMKWKYEKRSWLHFTQISASCTQSEGECRAAEIQETTSNSCPQMMILGYQASDKLLQTISVFFLLMALFMLKKKIRKNTNLLCWLLLIPRIYAHHLPLEQVSVNRQMRGNRLLFFLPLDIVERFPLVTQ